MCPELLESGTTDAINESTTFDEDQVTRDVTRKHMYENLSVKLVSDQESQTVYSKYELSAKVYIYQQRSIYISSYPARPRRITVKYMYIYIFIYIYMYVCIIDRVRGQDGWILVEFSFCVLMD